MRESKEKLERKNILKLSRDWREKSVQKKKGKVVVKNTGRKEIRILVCYLINNEQVFPF